jgi:hypothetical protein
MFRLGGAYFLYLLEFQNGFAFAAYADTSADLIAQFNELTGLRERPRKAQLSVAPSGADLPLSYPAAGGVS